METKGTHQSQIWVYRFIHHHLPQPGGQGNILQKRTLFLQLGRSSSSLLDKEVQPRKGGLLLFPILDLVIFYPTIILG